MSYDVTTVFDHDKKVNGAEDLLVVGDEILAFAGDPKKTQRIVVRGPSRKVASIAEPKAWLQGLWMDDDTWRIGGPEARLYVSSDAGKTWQAEEHLGLAEALGGPARVWAVARFDGALWASSETGVARQVDGVWQAVAMPEELRTAKPYPHEGKFLPRVVVVGDALYVLAKGIGRWDGAALAMELACEHDVHGLARTSHGTLIAAGGVYVDGAKGIRGVWRKPSGSAWELLPEGAVTFDAKADPAERDYMDNFVTVVCEGDLVVLVGRFEKPDKQMHMIRVSEDDGQMFRHLTAKANGYLVATGACADGAGGVFVTTNGGVLFRVSRDGFGTWADVPAKPPRAPKK